MLKCKHCKGTEFGLEYTEVKVTPVKAKDGKVIGTLAEPKISTSSKVVYCFGCNGDITDADVIESEICPVCNAEVELLEASGCCKSCDDQKNALLNMSKEELIMMMMKGMTNQNLAQSESDPGKKPKQTKEEVKAEGPSETKEKPATATKAKEEKKKEEVEEKKKEEVANTKTKGKSAAKPKNGPSEEMLAKINAKKDEGKALRAANAKKKKEAETTGQESANLENKPQDPTDQKNDTNLNTGEIDIRGTSTGEDSLDQDILSKLDELTNEVSVEIKDKYNIKF